MIIVFVDHEKESLDEVIHKIGSPKRLRSTMKSVSESCQLQGVLLRPQPRSSLVDRAIKKIEDVTPERDFILVDLSFDDETKESSVEYGRELALRLREHFTSTAVGVYSKFDLSPTDRALIMSDGFILQLDDIRKMYGGSRSLKGDDWYNLFHTSLRKSKDRELRLPAALSPTENAQNIFWADNHSHSRSLGFTRAAPKLVACVLEYLNLPRESQISMSQISGGFSGPFLVKAEILGGASFVVKIDEDPSRLEKELSGYHKVEARFRDHKHYLPIRGPYQSQPARLTEDWWAAFAMAYELDAKPLLEQPPSTEAELANLYTALWSDCLFNLYGKINSAEVAVLDVLPDELAKIAKDGWDLLGRYRKPLLRIDESAVRTIEAFISELETKYSDDSFKNRRLLVPWVEQIHGDLNCRNILYNKAQGTFCLLDFPHVGPPNCLAFDFVKAEAEFLLLMLDWSTGEDCDFERIQIWRALSSEFAQNFLPPFRTFSDLEADRAFVAVTTIRKLYKDKTDGDKEIADVYRTYLFSRVVQYLNYSDLTVAKRLFAFVWASQLFRVLPEI